MTIGFKIMLLAAMLFCHVVDDYYLQSVLASMKQRTWWEKNAPDELYKKDYKMALYEHAFSWSFVMALPLLVVAIWQQNQALYFVLFISYIANTLQHAYIDDMKANKHKINLIHDQIYHFHQVLLTWIFGIIFI